MHWARKSLTILGCAVLVLGLVACGPSAEEQMAAEVESMWAEVEAAKVALAEARADAAAKAAELAAATEEGAEEGVGELEAAVEAAQEAAVTAADTFNEKLIGYLNQDAMIEGEPPTERQTAAIRMKTAEDILIAEEFIDKGGNYKRALDIYEAALLLDPDNEELKTAIAYAEEMRYMTPERLAQVKKKMTADEVRELLGPVNLNFIKKYDDRGVTAWFYPREDGGAAAVFFETKNDALRVYEVNYDATKPPEAS